MTDKKIDVILKMEHVNKIYGHNRAEAEQMMRDGADKSEVYKKTGCTVALWDVNIEVPRGKIFVIIGLSGSGKSTAVRCINGLTLPTSGKILFDGRDVGQMKNKELLSLRRDSVSMVFQSFGLMSHRDILNNVAYGLEVKGVPKEEREETALQYIKMVGLDGLERKSCDQLSGGMRQRVGIARALASGSDVLLMDEPFSALDPLVRLDMQFELLQIQRRLGKTIVFITHDIDEAFKLGDVVAIMRDGKVIQVDTPVGMSEHPADDYVRRFIDSADKSKVLAVENVMMTPTSLIRIHDTPAYAVREMWKQKLSSAYVVDDDLRLMGVLTISDAVKARNENIPIEDVVLKDVACTHKGEQVSGIIPIAAESPYPIAVVDENNILEGIVTKSSVLSSLS